MPSSTTQGQPTNAPTAPWPDATPKPYEATFGPDYPSVRPSGPFTAVDDAVISADGRQLTIAFTGGGAYAPGNFCSTDYAPWVAVNGDALDLAVVAVPHPDQPTAPPNVGCAAMGYPYTWHLLLGEPFVGSTIHDLAGGTLWVREPAGLVTPKQLPSGWHLRLSEDEPAARPPLWARVYAPAGTNIESPNRGAGQLDLYQAFGAATNIGGGPERQDVLIDGVPAVLMREEGFGEWLLQWMVGADGVALVANEADLTLDQLLEIARAIEPAT